LLRSDNARTPLYVHTLVRCQHLGRALFDSDIFSRDEAVSLTTLLQNQADFLDEDERRVVRDASLIAGPFDIRVLEIIGSAGETPLRKALERLREAGIRAIRGDATDRRVLERAGAARARVVTSEIRRPRDNAVLLEMARGTPVLVRVFEDEEARWVRDRGGEPILYSDATAEGLIEWFLDHRGELDRNAATRSAGIGSGEAGGRG